MTDMEEPSMTDRIEILKAEIQRLRGTLQGVECALRREAESTIPVDHGTFCGQHAAQIRHALKEGE